MPRRVIGKGGESRAPLPIGGLLALNPGVRYGRTDVDFASRGTLETRYFIADVGLILEF